MLPVSAEVKTSPLQKANFCSRLFVWWLNPLFKIGHKRKLEPDDMYSVLPEDRSQHLGEELQGYWDQEVKRAQKDAREPSLVKAIIKCYWKSYLIWGMFTFLEVKDIHTVHCFLVYVFQYRGGRDRWGERPVV
ncbi:ATP-binding cassette subfamily C member 4-like [Ovis aries]|uniref:ATP-binding cassette subfamily C member 4-like n=1 Tax=Ovis aries TaxID=9940 RepID=UPI001C2E0C78|nr:ATP-binding cassette subfamily C member 4-like [Ovis aries]